MVGARAPGEKWLFLKDALWGWGGTHRSWPGGRGGRPRALIVGEGSAWRGKAGWVPTKAGLVDGGSGRRGKGFGSGGVGGRDTGPRDGANFATYVVFLSFLTRTKRRKMACFEGLLVGWGGGVPTAAGLVHGGVDQGPWLQERVGGRRDDGSSREASPGKGSGKGWLGGRRGCKGFGCGGVGGRGTGPRDGANFAVCRIFVVSNAYKKKKNGFF